MKISLSYKIKNRITVEASGSFSEKSHEQTQGGEEIGAVRRIFGYAFRLDKRERE